MSPDLDQDLRPLGFELEPPPDGYAWWYVDGLSDDGRYGLVLLLFIGSVFSPSYARARRRDGPRDPHRHCAVNFVVYPLDAGARRELGGKLWCFNEGGALRRSPAQLEIGASSMRWTGAREQLEVEIDEPRTWFFGRPGPRVRGRLRLRPDAIFSPRVELDPWRDAARHRWYPVAPRARIEVELDAPRLRFSGSGYHDVNEGDEPLERGFRSWTWARSEIADGALIAYDVIAPDGRAHARAWRFEPHADGAERAGPRITPIDEATLGERVELGRTRWGVGRSIRGRAERTRLVHTLEDTPFYTRNVVATEVDGVPIRAVHESVDLRRYAARWVQFLLPFKINERPASLALTGDRLSQR